MTEAQAFLDAVRAGHLEALRKAVHETPALMNAHDTNCVSAVMLAMYHGHAETARLLARIGVEIGPFETCMLGTVDRLKAMLAADRDLAGSYSADGFTLLPLAAFFGQPEVAEMLLAFGAGVKAVARSKMGVRPLHSAAAANQTQIALELIQRGVDVNARQQGGFTPLHAAAQNGNLDLVRALL
jgi:ankyrin repeat protein